MIAAENLRAHKLRSFLTLLGIGIGVMTVIVVASILAGLRNNVVDVIEQYGTENIYAYHMKLDGMAQRTREEQRRKPLTVEDAAAIKQDAPSVKDVAMSVSIGSNETISLGNVSYSQTVPMGVSGSYDSILTLGLEEGRFLSETDDHHRRNVIVIGSNVAESLFLNDTRMTGKEVIMKGQAFEIIGVLEKRKANVLGQNRDNDIVLIPFRTAQKLLNESPPPLLIIQARSGQLDGAKSEVEEILRRRREVPYRMPNNFDLSTADSYIEQFEKVTGGIELIAITISSIALVVGGIGVTNIMIVTVTERTQEIGIRMAVGARRRDIIRLFLLEAVMVTFLGGILGVALAIATSRIILLMLPTLPAAIPARAVVAGLVVSIVAGLAFGVWPARKASGMNPIDCLHYE